MRYLFKFFSALAAVLSFGRRQGRACWPGAESGAAGGRAQRLAGNAQMGAVKRLTLCLTLAAAVAVAGCSLGGAETLTGRAVFVDGDTLILHVPETFWVSARRVRVRLHGIDAPEDAQWCEDWQGERYPCGRQVGVSLRIAAGGVDVDRLTKRIRELGGDWDDVRERLARGERLEVRCEGVETDRDGRLIAKCWAGETELNRYMVAEGLAVAYRRYSMDYAEAEDAARAAKRGIWAGRFVMPWDWRKGERLP